MEQEGLIRCCAKLPGAMSKEPSLQSKVLVSSKAAHSCWSIQRPIQWRSMAVGHAVSSLHRRCDGSIEKKHCSYQKENPPCASVKPHGARGPPGREGAADANQAVRQQRNGCGTVHSLLCSFEHPPAHGRPQVGHDLWGRFDLGRGEGHELGLQACGLVPAGVQRRGDAPVGHGDELDALAHGAARNGVHKVRDVVPQPEPCGRPFHGHRCTVDRTHRAWHGTRRGMGASTSPPTIPHPTAPHGTPPRPAAAPSRPPPPTPVGARGPLCASALGGGGGAVLCLKCQAVPKAVKHTSPPEQTLPTTFMSRL